MAPRSGGRGSNQYRRRGAPTGQQVRDLVDIEAAAWAFTEDVNHDEMSLRSRDWQQQSRWAAHPDPAVRADLARSRNTNPAILELLAGETHPWVLEALAGNPRCPSHIVENLVGNQYRSVRAAALHNPAFDQTELIRLVRNDPDQIGVVAADNPRLDEDTIRWLADGADGNTSQSDDIAKKVTVNPNCPPDVLTRLVYDYRLVRGGQVAAQGLMHPRFPIDQLHHWKYFFTSPAETGKNVRIGVARNPNCPPEILMDLAIDPNQYVRKAVASHPAATPEMLFHLAVYDQSNKVNAAAIAHPDCPEDAVRQAVRFNHSTAVQNAAEVVQRRRGFNPWT